MRNGVPVRRPHHQCAQNQHVQRALHHLSTCLFLSTHRSFSPLERLWDNHTPLDRLWEDVFPPFSSTLAVVSFRKCRRRTGNRHAVRPSPSLTEHSRCHLLVCLIPIRKFKGAI